MKKVLKTLTIVAFFAFFASCGSSKKGCGLTAEAQQIENININSNLYLS